MSEIGKTPPAADMRYEDEAANRVSRVLVRVEWANGKIREYEAAEPEAFSMNDPEAELRMQPMRMSVQAGGSPVVPMMAATPKVELSFRLRFHGNPRRALQIRTERTAGPSGGHTRSPVDDQDRAVRVGEEAVARGGDAEVNRRSPIVQASVDFGEETTGLV